MARQEYLLVLGLLGLLYASPVRAEDRGRPAAPADPVALAGRIDRLIEEAYRANEVTPAPPADDAEFLRRAYLDLTGRIPSVAQVHRFLDSKSPGRRAELIEELLGSAGHVNHFAHVWRDALLPPSANQQARFFATQLEAWLLPHLRDNTPLDEVVRDLLTAPVVFTRGQPGQQAVANNNLRAFYQANEFKPENLAGSVSRLFLGVKLECAQCHNHPFASWSQDQFWELAAFFAGLQPQQGAAQVAFPTQERLEVREIAIPGKDRKVQARFLDGKQPGWRENDSPREKLAGWITARDNPFFARAAVNRLWAHLFGQGIVDPIDEMGEENPPFHPELLDALAGAFVQSGYDVQFLLRAICLTRTYQRSSARTHPSQDDQRLFARMALKGLTAEQLFDSLVQATGYQDTQGQGARGSFLAPGTIRGEFLARFDNSVDRRTEQQTSILQALAMMNGRLTAAVTDLQNSRTLAAVLDSPFMDDRQRLETLFLATLARTMRPQEEARLLRYVTSGGPSGDTRKALADVFWVLLNSGEFSVNH